VGKARFELFAGISLALHGAVLAGAMAKRVSVPVAASASDGTAAGSSAAVGGETFDVSEVADAPATEPGSDETPPIEIDQPAEPTEGIGPGAVARTDTRARHPAHAPAAPPSPPPPTPQYGAVGDRSAGDLVQTFKRVFPIAASSDPSWDHVPVGFYADGDVTFVLGEDGSLEHATASASSAAAFRTAIGRTTTLMKHRLFTAASPTTHLHMVLRVTSQLVNHGAFTIDAAGSFELPSGRHVSVTIAERRERGARN
jgi:hypothetical protein